MSSHYTKWFQYILTNLNHRRHVNKVISEKTGYPFNFGPIRWGHLINKISEFIKSDEVSFTLLIPITPQEIAKDSHRIKNIRRKHISDNVSPLSCNEVLESQIIVVKSKKNEIFEEKMMHFFREDDTYQELSSILPLVGQVDLDVTFYINIPNDNAQYQIKHFMQVIQFFKPKLNLIKAFDLLNQSCHNVLYNQAMVKDIRLKSKFTRRGFSYMEITVNCRHNTLFEV